MYDAHVPVISAYMREHPAGFVRGCLFAICSIQQPITGVPAQLDDIALLGSESRFLWGHKRKSYTYLLARGDIVWREVLDMQTMHGKISALLRVPGLGIVKSAFILQLMGYDIACLDTRNIKREGRNPRTYSTHGQKPHKLRKKVARYIRDTGGKARQYWDDWCDDVANAYDLTPFAVSELHMSIVPESFVPF